MANEKLYNCHVYLSLTHTKTLSILHYVSEKTRKL